MKPSRIITAVLSIVCAFSLGVVTRVARFILQELGGRVYGPLGRTDWAPGSVLASAAVVISWGLLISTGSVSTIWPMFGVANQLLAAIALCVGTTIILKTKTCKARYALATFIPMVFMAVMTFTASWELYRLFASKAASSPVPSEALTYRLDSILVAVLAVFAAVALADSAIKWRAMLARDRRAYASLEDAVDNEGR